MHQKILLILVAAVSAFAMAGEDKNTKSELAEKLTQLLGYSSLWQNSAVNCKQTDATFNPNVIYKSNPGSFGGISPSSSYWPRIESIYRNYQLDTCNTLNSQGNVAIFAKRFSEELTEAELRASIRFYSSPEGQRLVQTTLRAGIESQNYAKKSVGSYDSETYIATTKALAEVVREYQKHPQ